MFFFFNDTATTEIYTLSLHDALPISRSYRQRAQHAHGGAGGRSRRESLHGDVFHLQDWTRRRHRQDQEFTLGAALLDRKSTRLNSSHLVISYAVFCLKKKKTLAHAH